MLLHIYASSDMMEMTGHLKPVTSFSLVPSSKAKKDEKVWESKWAEAGSKIK